MDSTKIKRAGGKGFLYNGPREKKCRFEGKRKKERQSCNYEYKIHHLPTGERGARAEAERN